MSRGGADHLLALHDELDGLDKKESFAAVSLVLFVLAGILVFLGMAHGNTYLEVNGLFSSFGGLVLGGRELSKWRRMRSLRREIDRIEDRMEQPVLGGVDPEEGSSEEGALL